MGVLTIIIWEYTYPQHLTSDKLQGPGYNVYWIQNSHNYYPIIIKYYILLYIVAQKSLRFFLNVFESAEFNQKYSKPVIQ